MVVQRRKSDLVPVPREGGIRPESWVTEPGKSTTTGSKKHLKGGRGSPPKASDRVTFVVMWLQPGGSQDRPGAWKLSSTFNIDKPIIRAEVMYVKDTDHIIFHLYVSTKHLVKEPTYRSRRKRGDLQCVWKRRGKCLDWLDSCTKEKGCIYAGLLFSHLKQRQAKCYL